MMGNWALVLAAFLLLPLPLAAQETGNEDHAGKVVYDRWCAGCHGTDGRGEGPGALTMLPRPRDFTRALYQVRTTGSGELPTDDDIMHVINVGMPGTAMPGWEDLLGSQERENLVTYLKSMSRFFNSTPPPAQLEFSNAPRVSDARIAEGAEIYEQVECSKCHGRSGRADGPSAPTQKDGSDLPIYPANLTQNWRFNGGGTVEDIYRSLRTGLDGTPMASFSDLINAGVITDDQFWSLAHYVRSLSPEEPPRIREVITAANVGDGEGELPTSPTDERWETVDKFYIPLVGQIVVKPRWFNPRVQNLWVQALHDSADVAMLVSWSDPSRSPDEEWAPFAQRIVETMGPKDKGSTWAPGAPDQLVVQFPLTLPTGMERPYFLQGDARRPAYMWSWRGDHARAVEMVARGLGTGQEQPASSQQVSAEATWADGEWRVLFRRSLATPDSTADLQLPRATVVPVAFQAWDGNNGEAGNQAAVSTWYFLALEEAVPVSVFITPLVVFLLAGGLGLVMVVRAQRREIEMPGQN